MNFALQQTVPLFDGASLIGEASTHVQTRRLVGLEFLPQEYQSSYWLTDLALGYHSAHGRWSLTAYVNNVADKTVMNITTPQPLVGGAIIGTALRPPRTYGARAQVNF
jgi:iron complex outermembrane recepter protein